MGEGGANWRQGTNIEKSMCYPEHLIGDRAFIGYRALIRIFTVL